MAAPTHQLLVAGVDRTTSLQQGWQIQQTFGQRGHTFQCTLVDTAVGNPTYTVKPMDTVLLKDSGFSTNLFGGLVLESQLSRPQLGRTVWDVTCKDYTILLDKTIVKADYINKTADFIIKDIVSQVPNSAVTSANVSAGPLLARVVINYLSATEAINRVTRLAGQGAVYGWYVDESRDLHWYNQTIPTPNVAYFTDDPLDPGINGYRYNPDTFGYSWNGTDIRNRVYVRGATSTQRNSPNVKAENWTGNGSATSWPLTFPIDTTNPTLTLTVGGVSKTVAVDSGGPATTQYVVTKVVPGGTSIRATYWLQTGTDSAPGNNVAVALNYNYVIPVVAQVDDTTSQAAYAAVPNGGVFWTVVNDQQIADLQTAIKRGRRELQEYSTAQERVRFHTIAGNFVNVHMKAGDIIKFASTTVPDSQAAYAVGGLSANYICIRMSITGDYYRVYDLEAIRIS